MLDENFGLFACAFLVSGFAGLAALLRSGAKLTSCNVCSSFLNSGILGLGISLLWYSKYQEDVYFLVGICVLAGLGGMTTVDYVMSVLRKGGFPTVQVGKNGLPEKPKDE